MFKELTNDIFKSKCKVRLSNVLQGINEFDNQTVSYNSQEDFLSVIMQRFKENNRSLIIDFYFNRLNNESFEILLNSVSVKSKKKLSELKRYLDLEYTYFEVDDIELIESFVELSYKGIFFINFYFDLIEQVFWPSFKHEVIIFKNNDERFD